MKFLEKEGYIFISDLISTESKVHVRASKEDLYKYQVENARSDKFIKTLLRSYSGLFTEFIKISEEELARRMDSSVENIVRILTILQQVELIKYEKRKSKPQLIYLTERLDGKDIFLSPENYANLLQYSRDRLNAILQYVNNNTKCRSIQLLAYFGEKQKVRCGKCDVCIERNKIELSELEFDTVLEKIKPLLKQQPRSIKELADQVKGVNEDKIIKVIQWLLDNDKIMYNKMLELSWKEST